MIINIGGPHGAGKSTLVKRIMQMYGTNTPQMMEGRKRPYGYVLSTDIVGVKPLFVPGHYETACGGCDTLGSMPNTMDYIYQLVRGFHNNAHDVLYEGIMVECDVNRVVKLHEEGFPVRVLSIDITVEKCIEQINQRRREKNPDAAPVNPKNPTAKHRIARRRIPRLKEAGVSADFLPFDEAFREAATLLGIG